MLGKVAGGSIDPDPEEIGGIRWRVQGDPTWYEWAGQNVEWGFKQNLNINELIVLDGVLTLGDQSFSNNQITSLVLPDSVQRIGQNAFLSNALTHLEIGSGVTLLDNYAFKDNQLESVTIHAVNPPDFFSLSYLPFDNNPLTAIYVPAQSVAAYKSNQYWSVYSELIYEISEV